jgi:hypothetical protein
VVHVIFFGRRTLCLIRKRAALGKAVVDIPYQLTITERLASELRWKCLCEFLEIPELGANINVGL